jgi:hypothetical protein
VVANGAVVGELLGLGRALANALAEILLLRFVLLVCHLCLPVVMRLPQPVAGFSAYPRQTYPPIGALGLAPQNTCEPSIPIRWTSTMLRIIDLAVAWPTPTGPPEAV